jgi:hypothetical protein
VLTWRNNASVFAILSAAWPMRFDKHLT